MAPSTTMGALGMQSAIMMTYSPESVMAWCEISSSPNRVEGAVGSTFVDVT